MLLSTWDYWTTGIARRDEVKYKTEQWRLKQKEYEQRASEKGRLLQACKAEKKQLECEFLQIKRMDLFLEI